jgi:pyrroline-5-carboxylate reductase
LEKKFLEIDLNKIIFFGCGNIAQALILGLLRAKISNKKILVINKNPMHDVFLKKYGIKRIYTNDLGKYKDHRDILFLAVKPKDIRVALDQLRLSNYSGIVCSLAAGINLNKISKSLSSDMVVRAIPTTASAFGLGNSAIYSDAPKSLKLTLVKRILEKVGSVLVLKQEKDMHGFTAAIGSGQAFLMKLLIEYDIELSKIANAKKRKEILINFIKSLVDHLKNDGFEKAIQKIASKKGTTEAGLDTLKKLRGNTILQETFKATKIRSKEIENEFK